jgi:AraC-like DNA-binding protein
MTRKARPLDRFPLVRTQNAQEMCAALERLYAKPILRLAAQTKEVDVAVNYYPMDCIGLGNTKYGIGVSLVYPDSGVVMQTFPIRGRGEAAVDGIESPLDPDHGVIVSPHMRFGVTLAANYETLLLLIKPRTLAAKLAVMTGQSINCPLTFHPVQDYASPAAKALRNHFLFLVEMVSAPAVSIPKQVLAEFEQGLVMMFLYANRHNYSHLLEQASPGATLQQLRRAEEFIEANWRQAITLEQLAEVAGASTFSLFSAFKKYRGYSPREFSNQVRLRGARDLLRRADAGTTVAEIALACGFVSPGEFANDYIRAFGEHPSQALDRARGTIP